MKNLEKINDELQKCMLAKLREGNCNASDLRCIMDYLDLNFFFKPRMGSDEQDIEGELTNLLDGTTEWTPLVQGN